MLILKSVLIVIIVVVFAAIAAGQAGFLKGKTPSNLGVRDGRLRPPSPTPNSVSSQASLYLEAGQRTYASVTPLPLKGTGPATMPGSSRSCKACTARRWSRASRTTSMLSSRPAS